MTPDQHAALPARERLAKDLLAHVRSGRGIDVFVPRGDLYRYLDIAEDTIEAQAAMLTADLANCAGLQTEARRLRKQNASLRDLVEAALTAGQYDDGEAITIIRKALEGST